MDSGCLAPGLGYANSAVLKSESFRNKMPNIGSISAVPAQTHYALSEAFLAALTSHVDPLSGRGAKAPYLTTGKHRSAFADAPDAMGLRDIMMRFQSLGDNCEFGLLQRRAGAEPLDFLRFAGFYVSAQDLLQQTIHALTEGFAGIGNPNSIVCELHGHQREYMIRDVYWKLMYHSGLHEGEIDVEDLRSQQVSALRFRRREIMADMKAADRVFVWKSNVHSSEADVRDLVACLRRHGPNMLLWVNVEDADHPAGIVEYAGNGLLKGYVRRFAPYAAAEEIEFESWYAMCRSAAGAVDRLQQLGEWSHTTRDSQGL
jgi:hypothetical protein